MPWDVAFGLLLLALALPAPAHGAAQGLPVELSLDGRGLQLFLWNAEVEITVDPQGEPGLAVSNLEPAGAGARVRVEGQGSTVMVERSPQMAGADHRLHLAAVLHPGQGLELNGVELEVAVTDARYAGAGATPAPEAGPQAGRRSPPGGREAREASTACRLAVERSQVHFAGVERPAVTATDSWLQLQGTRGRSRLDLVGGVAEVRQHRGDLEVEGRQAEVKLVDHGGDVELTLDDASLEIEEGQGGLSGRVGHGTLLIRRWRGSLDIEGEASTLEARSVGGRDSQLRLQGRDVQALLDGVVGRATARLTGGTLRGENLEGRFVVEAWEGAEVRLGPLSGELQLNLYSGSTGAVVGAQGAVRGDVRQGALRAQGVGQLALAATGAEITVSRVERLGKLDLRDCRLELDLSGVRSPPGVALRGESFAQVRLSAPCRVEVLGAAALEAGRVEVTGCTLGVDERTRRLKAPREEIQGDTVVLQVALDEAASLVVHGGA